MSNPNVVNLNNLDTRYAPVAGAASKMAVLTTPYNTSGQPMVSYGQISTAGGSIAFSQTGTQNDNTSYYTITPGTLDTTTAANNTAGSITPLKPGTYSITVGVGFQTNAANQQFTISLAFGGSAIATDTFYTIPANSGARHTFGIPFRVSAADVAAGSKFTVYIYSVASFTIVCGIVSDTFMRVLYLGS